MRGAFEIEKLSDEGQWIKPLETDDFSVSKLFTKFFKVSKQLNWHYYFQCCNLMTQALWSKVDVSINDFRMDKSAHSSYGFKSFMETLFTFDESVKGSFLKTSLWEEDQPDSADVTTKANSNSGYFKRRELIKNGKKVFFSMRIHNDLFALHCYLLPLCSLKIEMQRSRENFFLIGAGAWADKLRVKLSDLKITLKTVTVAKELQDAHTNALATNSLQRCYYPRSSEHLERKAPAFFVTLK